MMNLNKHDEGCTPLRPCQTCKSVAFLRQELTPDQFERYVQSVHSGDADVEALQGTPVETVELSVRTSNLLKNLNIRTIEQLEQKTEAELLRNPGSGRKTVQEIRRALAELNRDLKQ